MKPETAQSSYTPKWSTDSVPNRNWPARGFYTGITTNSDAPVTVFGDTEYEAKERAELIVRAVNSHADLLEALKACLAGLQMECDECEGCKVDPCMQCRAKAAILAAEGTTDVHQ